MVSHFFSLLAVCNTISTSQALFHVCVSPLRRRTRSLRVTKSLQERTRIETTKLKLLYKLWLPSLVFLKSHVDIYSLPEVYLGWTAAYWDKKKQTGKEINSKYNLKKKRKRKKMEQSLTTHLRRSEPCNIHSKRSGAFILFLYKYYQKILACLWGRFSASAGAKTGSDTHHIYPHSWHTANTGTACGLYCEIFEDIIWTQYCCGINACWILASKTVRTSPANN